MEHSAARLYFWNFSASISTHIHRSQSSLVQFTKETTRKGEEESKTITDLLILNTATYNGKWRGTKQTGCVNSSARRRMPLFIVFRFYFGRCRCAVDAFSLIDAKHWRFNHFWLFRIAEAWLRCARVDWILIKIVPRAHCRSRWEKIHSQGRCFHSNSLQSSGIKTNHRISSIIIWGRCEKEPGQWMRVQAAGTFIV